MQALDSSRLPFNHHKLRQMALAASVSLRVELIIEADYPPPKVWNEPIDVGEKHGGGCASCGSFMSILLTRNVCIMFACVGCECVCWCCCVCVFSLPPRVQLLIFYALLPPRRLHKH